MRFARCFPRLLAAACFVTLASLATPHAARADELQDVSKLVADGKLDAAERRADAFLAQHPKDAQMRFLKGVILTQRGARAEAIKVYTGLTQDYPELPEPYNNLAVIYAAQGQYDKARLALETALRVTPNYATAYGNLGDVYVALAAQAYQNARRYDANDSAALRKLNAARLLLAGAAAPAAAAVAPAAASAAASIASRPVRSQRNIGLPSPAGAPASVVGVGATAPAVVVPANAGSVPAGSNIVAVENAPAADVLPATSTIATASRPADRARSTADVTAAVERWAVSRAVEVDGLEVRVDGDTAVAHFRASAASPRRVSNWVLTLKHDAAGWTITDARTEP